MSLAQAEHQRQAARPGLAVRGALSAARAWRYTAGARLARTLASYALCSRNAAASQGGREQPEHALRSGLESPPSSGLLRVSSSPDLFSTSRSNAVDAVPLHDLQHLCAPRERSSDRASPINGGACEGSFSWRVHPARALGRQRYSLNSGRSSWHSAPGSPMFAAAPGNDSAFGA